MCAWCLESKVVKVWRWKGNGDDFGQLHGEHDLDGVLYIVELSGGLGTNNWAHFTDTSPC